MERMESIGTYLKRQREMRKIRLEEVSQATKINVKTLAALERDNLKFLPSAVIAKGFVRSYAKAIGLNTDEVLLQMEDYIKQVPHLKPRKEKFTWLPKSRIKLKSWVFFVAFLVLVFLTAYFSSR